MPNLPVQSWQNGGSKSKGSASDATRMRIYPSIITIQMLDAVNPEGKNKQNIEALPYINKDLQVYKISNLQEIAHLLAQMAHESHLEPKAEDTNYRYTVARARWDEKIYGDFSKICSSPIGPRGEKVYKKGKLVLWCDKEKFLNIVYGPKNKNLGNDKPGDGYKFRGRGFLQTTGKWNYNKFKEFYKETFHEDQDFVSNPDLLSTSIKYATASSFYFWTSHNIGKIARRKNATVTDVTKPINKGLVGLSDRIKRFNKIASFLGVEQVTK